HEQRQLCARRQSLSKALAQGEAVGEVGKRIVMREVPKPFLVPPPLTDVARDLGKAEEFAGLVANRVDDHARPKMRSVLAHAHALGFETPFARGSFQDALGQTGLAVLTGEELAEMLADDLVRGVALEALSAGIPVRYHAGGIEHVDGKVGDALDKQPEPLLARRQILLGSRQKGCLGGGRRRCRVAPRRGLANQATLSTGKTYGLVYATRGVFAAEIGHS